MSTINANQNEPDRIIGSAELGRRVPYSPMHIWRLEQAEKFPRRIRIGANRVGWSEAEIDQWVEHKKAMRGEHIHKPVPALKQKEV